MAGDEGDSNEVMRLPEPDAKVAWVGFTLGTEFHPPIKLGRKGGLEFAAELAEIFEPENVHFETNEWRIVGGGVCEGIELVITKSSLRVAVTSPTNGLEWYENKLGAILRVIEQKFEPVAAFNFNVVMVGLVDLPKNVYAMAYVGGYVMLMHPSKLNPIGRSLEVIGIRLRFRGNEDDHEEGWDVDVRVESSISDPSKIYLNARAEWDEYEPWEGNFIPTAVSRIIALSNFMSERLVQFLRMPPMPDDEEGEEDEQHN